MYKINNGNEFYSDETFRFWDYKVSHDVLLLRSNNDDENLDIVFFGVFYFNSITMFKTLKIMEGNKTDYSNLTRFITHKNEKVFELYSGNEKFIIGSLGFSVHVNNLDFTKSSIRGEKSGLLIYSSNRKIIH